MVRWCAAKPTSPPAAGALWSSPSIRQTLPPLQETLDAIERANLITVGPGSLYTSLITNLLVDGIPSALAHARGIRVYICNLMTQANESLNLTASEHIERIYEHTKAPIFDCALVNTGTFSPGNAGPLRSRGRFADHPRHRAHPGPGRALHRRRLRQPGYHFPAALSVH
jgi:hypothetical protein